MKEFTFKFTEEEINYVINVLAQQPFGQVKPLIEKIQTQAAPQVEQPVEAVTEEV